MQYKVTIHYVRPCMQGGIRSGTQTHYISAPNEEEAEMKAKILGVNDPSYLYTSMIETERVFTV